MSQIQAIKDRAAINHLRYIIKDTFAQGLDAVTVKRLNEVLMIAEDRVINPTDKQEVELIDIK